MTTILHLSDLHVGIHFDPTKSTKWRFLEQEVEKTIKPDLIIVTGDLVNSPWPWTLNKARKMLEELRNKAGDKCQLVVVPGNHDTRWQGMLAVSQIMVFGGVFIGLAFMIAYWEEQPWRHIVYLAYHSNWRAFWKIIGGGEVLVGGLFFVGAILILLRFFLTTRLEKYLKPLLITSPTYFHDLKIGVLPFDSASKGIGWARGYVDDKGFLARQSSSDTNPSDDLFWIAAVHHHPLPLPYDSKDERMMILNNAGAFLSELRKRRVRLVLHGHKHHPHFTRMAVDPARDQSFELAVLSAGTPTEEKGQGNSKHGFNVIRISDGDIVTITQYEAGLEEPTFEKKPEFTMEPPELRGWAEHVRAAAKHHCTADSLVARGTINSDGDVFFRRVYYGVRVNNNAVIAEIKDDIMAETRGHVEGLEAGCLSRNFTALTLKIGAQRTVGRMTGKIRFADENEQGGLRSGDGSIDFYTQFYANNGIALWDDELRHMYPTEKERATEWVTFTVLDGLPVREAYFIVEFSAGYPRPTSVQLLVKYLDTWSPLGSHSVTVLDGVDRGTELIVAMPYPLPKHEYQIKWCVSKREGGGASDQEQAQAKAEELAHWLVEQLRDAALSKLSGLLGAIERLAKKYFGNEDLLVPQYNVTLYGYDEQTQKLRWSASLQGTSDPYKGWEFSYGNGLPGRALRTALVTVFRKQALKNSNSKQWLYLRGDGEVIDNIKKINELVLIAVPLVATMQVAENSLFSKTGRLPGPAYGVLQIATSKSLAWLNTKDDVNLLAFAAIANEKILSQLEDIMVYDLKNRGEIHDQS
ncbi:metallophosphoesterase [Nitrosospira sp. Nsp1]|uniref:metallophosphoesterase family protein n=1 Tax=Nitrosospira sp. Nsp1 TaxID=136547 RepID=UPI0008878112|nr:metallophosphoesterase [Nitrosospira sp. Nsp1]SCX62460.1 Calcineurin-like phosphoesterase [Nitrosospira sp. Nsp1]